MTQNIEIEYKNLLLEDEFYRVVTYFQLSQADFFKQENHYFDTKKFALKDIGCALRIRQKNGHYEMTLKQPHPEGLLETNENLLEQQAQNLLKGETLQNGIIYTQLISLGITPKELSFFGTLTTERAERDYKGGLLVLDRSSYLNIQDYEVEYEVTDKAIGEEIFKQLLIELQIPIRKTKNKVKRFYDRKRLLEKEHR